MPTRPFVSVLTDPRRWRERFAALAAALVALMAMQATALAQTAVRFTLDWRLEGPAALFLLAQERGYFKAEGLDVTIEPGAGSRETVTRVASGSYDIGFGDVNSLIRYRDENPGRDLKAVMMVYDRPPFAIVGRKSRGITGDLRSLDGKKVAAPAADGAFAQWPVLKAVTKLDDRGIRLETVGFLVREPMLASGEVDAVFGFAHSTYVSLKARGVPAEDIVLMLMADHGLELYGNALIASPAFMAEKPEALRGFLRAVTRSVRDVLAEPQAGIAALMKRNDTVRPEVELERLKMVLDQNVMTPWVRTNGFGGIDPDRWSRALDQIDLAFSFKDKTRAADAFTDRFLPASSERVF